MMDLAGMKRRELQALCKRHGLPAGGTNVDLVARLDAALSGGVGSGEAEEVRAAARKGCLKRTGGDAADAKKVTFAAEEAKARRLRSRVIWSPVVAKTRGRRADSAAEDGVSAEAGADVPLRRSRRNSVVPAQVEEAAEAVAADRKRKRKGQENDDGVAVSAQVGVSSRVTRRSSLSGAAVVLPPAVETKRGRGKAADSKAKPIDEAQDLSAPGSPAIVETKRSRGKREGCEPDVQKSAKMEVSARATMSRSAAPAVVSSTVVQNKRKRNAGDAQPDVKPTVVSDVPRNDAPVTRSLRNRVVQAKNSEVEETCIGKQPDNKMQPSRQATRRNQRVASTVELQDREQVAAPTNGAPLRRSGRNNSEASNANLETKKLGAVLVEAKDLNIGQPSTSHNAKAEYAEKHPAAKGPVRRVTRKSVVSATLEKEVNNLIEEKNPETHVRRSMRKSVVPVQDIKGIGEEIQDGNNEDVVKKQAIKGAVRQSRRKSTVPAAHEKEEDYIAEKNTKANERRSTCKSVIPVKDTKVDGEEIQDPKGKDVGNQLVLKQPIRRSSRKSVLPDTLTNDIGFLVAERNAGAHVRSSTRKSVLPNMLNEKNQDQSKMAINENFQSGKCEDVEKPQKAKDQVRRSRRSVATVVLEEQNKGLHEEKISNIPVRRSARKSIALNVVEKGSMDHNGMVEHEQERVDEDGSRLRKRRRSSMEIPSSANDSLNMEVIGGQKFGEQQNAQSPDEKDDTEDNYDKPLKTQHASDSKTSKGRPSKTRQKSDPEEMMCVKEANDDLVIKEATNDAPKATYEYIKESSSTLQELCQVDATREESSSAPLFVTVTLPDEIRTLQSVQNVIPGSESGDTAKESSDKSTVDSQLSETRNVELDQSSISAELVPHNSTVSDDKTSMAEDVLSLNFTVGDHEKQSPVGGQGRVVWETNASESGEKDLADVMSIGLHTKIMQHDIDILAKETHKDVEPLTFKVEEHGEKYLVSPLTVEKGVSGKGNVFESAAKLLPGILSNGLCATHLQHDSDELTKEIGEASAAALPISDSNPEIHCDTIAEEGIRAADMEKCPSKSNKGKPLFTNLYSEGAADDSTLPALNAEKGRSSDGGHSSFSLEFLFAEECKESYSRNVKNTVVEVDGGNKPNACGTPGIYVGSKDEDVRPTGCDTDKKLDVGQDVAEEEVAAEEKSNDQHVTAKTDLKTNELAGLDMESDCRIAEKDVKLDADNPVDQQAILQVQQGDVQEGDLEKASLYSETPECKHECGFPEEILLCLKKSKGCLSSVEQSPFGLQSLFLQESIEEPVKHGFLASATTHTGDGFDELKDCHVKCALEKTHVSEPFSHHVIDKGSCSVSKTDDSMGTTQQENMIEESLKASLDEEQLLPGVSLDTNHMKLINSVEAACKSKESKKLDHSEDLKDSSEITNGNGTAAAVKAYDIGDTELSGALHAPPNEKNDYCLGFNTDVLHQGHSDRYSHDRDFSNILDSGSVMATVGDITPSGSGFPKDSSMEYNPQQELSNSCSVEKSLDGSTTCGEKFVSRADTIENSPFCLETPGYKYEGALSEEAERTMKNYAGTRSSNPRELLMELQSLFSKENIEESDAHGGPAVPTAESSRDLSIDSEQRVQTSESTDLLVELTGCFNIGVLHQGHKDRCSDDRAEEVGSRPCKKDIVEADPAKYTESGLMLLPSKERSNFKDGKLYPKLESPIVMEYDLKCNNDASNTSDNGSVMATAGERTPSSSGLPEDHPTDQYPQQEPFNGFSVESSLQATAFGKKVVSCAAGTIGNPSLNLETPDYKHEGALSEEAVHKVKSYTGTRSADPRHLLIELQSLFSGGSTENSDPCDELAFPSAGSGRDEPSTCDAEKLVDTLVSSEPDTYQGPCQDLSSRAKEKESSMSVSVQDNESGGFLRSSHMKDRVMSPQIDLLGDAHLIKSNVVEEVLCEEKEKGASIERDIADEMLCEDKERRMSTPTSDGYGVLRQLQQEFHYEHNVNQVASGICAMLEASPAKMLESGISLVQAVETSVLLDKQHNLELECNEIEKHSSNCEKDTNQILGTGSVPSKSPLLPKDSQTTYCHDEELPNDLSTFQSAEESVVCQDECVFSSGICQSRGHKHIVETNSKLLSSDTEVLHEELEEECGKPNEDKFTPKVPEYNVPDTSLTEGMENATRLPSAAGMLEMHDEQLSTKMIDEGEEHRFSCDKDEIGNFCNGSVKNDKYQSPKDCHVDSCQEHEVVEYISLPKSPEESANCQDESAAGSGPCQTSEQECINRGSAMQVTSNIEVVNEDHVQHNGTNEDHITPGIPFDIVSEAAESEQSEREIGLTPAAGTVASPDEQVTTKQEGSDVDEYSCSYETYLFDGESLSREHKVDPMDLSSEDNHPDDLPAPKSPERPTVLQDDSVLGSVGVCQSSRRSGIDELRAKLQRFKVSSAVKGSYIGMSAPRPKPAVANSMSQAAIAVLRNRENTPAAKAGHPVKPANTDRSVTKDSSRRALQPISGRPREQEH